MRDHHHQRQGEMICIIAFCLVVAGRRLPTQGFAPRLPVACEKAQAPKFGRAVIARIRCGG